MRVGARCGTDRVLLRQHRRRGRGAPQSRRATLGSAPHGRDTILLSGSGTACYTRGMDGSRLLWLASVWLHVVTAALWVGGMLFLVVVLVPLMRTPALRGQAVLWISAVGLRFRTVGWASLLVLVVTGTINAAFRAGSLAGLGDAAWWTNPFGRLLGMKLGLVGLILVLSAVHDFGVGPRASELMRAEADSPRARRWRAAASWMGRLNLLLALLVVALAVALVRGGF